MSAEWWRTKDGDGYTSNIDYADPWDITRKQTAREWVATGQEPGRPGPIQPREPERTQRYAVHGR